MLCSHELLLPDRSTLHTRMLLGAWEAGLDAVSEEATDILLLSLEVRLTTPSNEDTCMNDLLC